MQRPVWNAAMLPHPLAFLIGLLIPLLAWFAGRRLRRRPEAVLAVAVVAALAVWAGCRLSPGFLLGLLIGVLLIWRRRGWW